MRVNNPLLFFKFLAMMVAFVTIAPVLLFVPLPFWAHTLLLVALSYSFYSWVAAAAEADGKRN